MPEGTLLTAKMFLRLGLRATVNQSLSRLAKREELMRVGQGHYVLPAEGRYSKRAPSIESVIGQA